MASRRLGKEPGPRQVGGHPEYTFQPRRASMKGGPGVEYAAVLRSEQVRSMTCGEPDGPGDTVDTESIAVLGHVPVAQPPVYQGIR